MIELIYFAVKNLYSFGNEVEFSMESNNVDKRLVNNLIKIDDKTNLSPVAALYGANASGKTNLLKSIKTLKKLVIESGNVSMGVEFPLLPFKLLENHPTTFKIIFLSKGIKYSYYLELTKEKVLKEYLYESPNGRQAKIFEREFDEKTNTYTYEYKRNKELKDSLSSIEEKCLKNKLFLSTLAIWTEVPQIKNPFMFFLNDLIINGNNDDDPDNLFYAVELIEKDENIKKLFLDLFKEINPGIKDVIAKIEKRKVSMDELPSEMPMELKTLISQKESNSIKFKTVYSNGMVLDLGEESRGTNKLVKILSPIIKILERGNILLLDELETALHPIISEKIIGLFLNKKINRNGAQIIFSTHDINLLNFDILRKDQIWFLERTEETGFISQLYSLANLKGVRKDENIKKNYIKGKYSWVPCLNNYHLQKFFNDYREMTNE